MTKSNASNPAAQPDEPTATRLRLLAAGYRILPNRAKAPVRNGWQTPGYVAQELQSNAKGSVAERVARWPRRFPEAQSTGVRLDNGLAVIDGDVDDDGLAGALWSA